MNNMHTNAGIAKSAKTAIPNNSRLRMSLPIEEPYVAADIPRNAATEQLVRFELGKILRTAGLKL